MPKTKYDRIYRDLKTKIEAGDYEYQELLPSESSLINEYDCSRNTVRRAIAALVRDGYVQTMQGKGVRNIYRPLAQASLPWAPSNPSGNPRPGTTRKAPQKWSASRN